MLICDWRIRITIFLRIDLKLSVTMPVEMLTRISTEIAIEGLQAQVKELQEIVSGNLKSFDLIKIYPDDFVF